MTKPTYLDALRAKSDAAFERWSTLEVTFNSAYTNAFGESPAQSEARGGSIPINLSLNSHVRSLKDCVDFEFGFYAGLQDAILLCTDMKEDAV